MAGTIVIDRIESDASYASTINVANRITFSNTVNFGVTSGAPVAGFYSPSTNNLVFTTASTERMRIDSAGNVGIGTSSPVKKLHVNGDIRLGDGGGTGAFFTDATVGLRFMLPASGTSSTEAMRIDSSGNVMIGTTTSQVGAKLAVTGGIQGTITSGTAVASTSGTSIDFTGIPSWVKRITVMFNAVSTSGGTSNYLIQVGSGSVSTSGYNSRATYFNPASIGGGNSTAGIMFGNFNVSTTLSGAITLTLFSSNTWVATGYFADSGNAATSGGGVTPALGGALDRIRITNVNGTDVFDAGTVNILYEG